MDSIRLLREDVIKLQNADMATRDQINKIYRRLDELTDELKRVTGDNASTQDTELKKYMLDHQKFLNAVVKKDLDKSADDLLGYIKIKAEIAKGKKGIHRRHFEGIKKSVARLEELIHLYDEIEEGAEK